MKIKNLKLKINSSGFTLIELLVVIVIIGILSTLIMANFVGIRQRARDGQRKTDLRQIQAALEIYRADQGKYPTTIPACGSTFKSADEKSTYMQKIPCGPLGQEYTYESPNGLTYTIFACLENDKDDQLDKASGNPVLCQSFSDRWKLTLQNP